MYRRLIEGLLHSQVPWMIFRIEDFQKWPFFFSFRPILFWFSLSQKLSSSHLIVQSKNNNNRNVERSEREKVKTTNRKTVKYHQQRTNHAIDCKFDRIRLHYVRKMLSRRNNDIKMLSRKKMRKTCRKKKFNLFQNSIKAKQCMSFCFVWFEN